MITYVRTSVCTASIACVTVLFCFFPFLAIKLLRFEFANAHLSLQSFNQVFNIDAECLKA